MPNANRNNHSAESGQSGAAGRAVRIARGLSRASIGLVLASRCGGCGDALAVERAASWCVHCSDRWGPLPGGWPAGSAGCAGWSAAAYRGPVRRCVLVAKRGAPGAAIELLLRRWPPGQLPTDAVVTWVPGHALRTARSPDSGRLIATALAEREGLAAIALLRRSPLGRRQAGRSDEQRRHAPNRLGLRATPAVARHVILIDDVRTTGTTLDHAAILLRDAGAISVFALTVAVAPSLIGR